VYKEVEIVNRGLLTGTVGEPATVTVSYDEKPGIQALGGTTPDRPPVPGTLAGLDLHTGRVGVKCGWKRGRLA
jgi:hypothetical protein